MVYKVPYYHSGFVTVNACSDLTKWWSSSKCIISNFIQIYVFVTDDAHTIYYYNLVQVSKFSKLIQVYVFDTIDAHTIHYYD